VVKLYFKYTLSCDRWEPLGLIVINRFITIDGLRKTQDSESGQLWGINSINLGAELNFYGI
jgi:hypothetical protein